MRRLLALALAAGLATPGAAATRAFTVTGFDRINVAGPFSVTVRTGPGVSVRATGDNRALDRLSAMVDNNVLKLRASNPIDGNWQDGDVGKVAIAVTVPSLRAATLGGSGDLTIDRARADQFDALLGGSGNLSIGALQADRAVLSLIGSGDLTVAGKVETVRAALSGSGNLAAAELLGGEVRASVVGSGDLHLAASRKASISASGSGDVIVTGNAECTVVQHGSGTVECGRKVR